MLLPMSTACMHIEENDGSIFVVPSSKEDQLPIIFGKLRHWITTPNDSDEDLEPLQFFHYTRSAHRMMKEMGYDLHRGEGLNFGKGWHIPLQPFVPKGKPANYYDQTHRGLGYTTPSIQSNSESEKSLLSHFSNSSDWESDISVGVGFKKLFINMTSIVRRNQKRALNHSILIYGLNNLIFHGKSALNNATLLHKVIQIDVGDATHPKLISISESLSPTEKQDLISQIKEYIDVFAWSYEDMLVSILR